MSAILSLQFTIFGLIAVGFFLKRLRIIGDDGQRNLNDLVINVILPCNIFKAFLAGDTDGNLLTYVSVFLFSLGIQLFSVFYGKLVFRKVSAEKKKCLEYATVCSNSGFLGNPVAEGLYGMQGLILASIYLIPLRVMMWTSGIPIFAGTHSKRETIKKVATHPCILACLFGILAMLTHLRLPDGLLGIINALANCNTALSMVIIGMILTDLHPSHLGKTDPVSFYPDIPVYHVRRVALAGVMFALIPRISVRAAVKKALVCLLQVELYICQG